MARKSKKRGKNKVKHKKYKLKTHKATTKRFKATGRGKIMRTKGHQGHLKRRRSKRSKRLAMEMFEVPVMKDRRTIKRLAPNIEKKNK
jgi:large subunit ribosomal protein L35